MTSPNEMCCLCSVLACEYNCTVPVAVPVFEYLSTIVELGYSIRIVDWRVLGVGGVIRIPTLLFVDPAGTRDRCSGVCTSRLVVSAAELDDEATKGGF